MKKTIVIIINVVLILICSPFLTKVNAGGFGGEYYPAEILYRVEQEYDFEEIMPLNGPVYGDHSLDYEYGSFNTSGLDFTKVTVSTELYRRQNIYTSKYEYYITLGSSLNYFNYSKPYSINEHGNQYKITNAESTGLNQSILTSTTVMASIYTNLDLVILKDSASFVKEYRYKEYTYSETTRSGFIIYSYSHLYNENNVSDIYKVYAPVEFSFRGGNTILHKMDFSDYYNGSKNTTTTNKYNKVVVNNVRVLESIHTSLTVRVVPNLDNINYYIGSGEIATVSKTIDLSSLGVSYPAGISINPFDIIKDKHQSFRPYSDLQWRKDSFWGIIHEN